MNKYPSYLKDEPKPLVFITGTVDNEPDIHTKVIRIIEANIRDLSDSKDQPNILFRTVPADFSFPEKKPPKEQLSTEGILKYNWPLKHFESVPSVVILTVPFSVDWGPSEWQRREYVIHDKYSRLKVVLSARNVKLLVIAVRIGAGSIDKDSLEERISGLKKHLQVDSKTFACVSPAELTTDNTYIKKLSKSTREASSAYYSGRVRQLRSVLSGVGASEYVLQARLNYKIAFFYEFQGQPAQALRFYRSCYESLARGVDAVDEELLEQVKTVAEMAHFKVCNMLLYGTSVIEAFQQFHTHMARFSKLYCEHPWQHYAWVSDQHVVFAQLLELYAVNDSLPDADRAYYYHNAARYSMKRQASFEKMWKDLEMAEESGTLTAGEDTPATDALSGVGGGSSSRTVYKGLILMPPRFIGAPSQLVDSVLDSLQSGRTEESSRLLTEYLLDQERRTDHAAVIMGLLTLALERTHTNFKRRKGFLLSLIAEQNIKAEDYSSAMRHLCAASELHTTEGWVAPSVAVLGLIMKCAVLLGRPAEFLNAALILYSHSAQLLLSRYEVEDLHLSVVTLLEGALANTRSDCLQRPAIAADFSRLEKFPVRNKQSFLTSSFVALVHRPEFGSTAPESRPAEFCLKSLTEPDVVVVDLSAGKRMFDVQVSFSSAIVELGQQVHVRLSVSSRFMDDLRADEMRVHFTNDSIVKRFLDAGDSGAASSSAGGGEVSSSSSVSVDDLPFAQCSSTNDDVIHTALVLPAGAVPVRFEFPIYISETRFASFVGADSVLCLERIEIVFARTHSVDTDLSLMAHSVTKQVVFDVSALPEMVLRARRGPGKAVTLKDAVKFCYNDAFPTITIQKPSALITLLKPPPTRESTVLLTGTLQRVNVCLQVGACDMLDGCVYLSSDFTPQDSSRPENALFWYPDSSALQQTLAQCADQEVVSDAALDGVPFYPMVLNESLQPALPMSLGPVCPAESIIFLPLFVKSDSVGHVTVRLRVEYVPRGRLKSSLSKEFVLRLSFQQPLEAAFRMSSCGDVHGDGDSAVFAGQDTLLTASLRCLNSPQQYCIGVTAMSIHLTAPHHGQAVQRGEPLAQLSGDANGPDAGESILLDGREDAFPLRLRKGDQFEESRYFRCSEEAVRSGDDPTAGLVADIGYLRVRWRVMRRHLLRHRQASTLDKILTLAGSVGGWLPRLAHREAVASALGGSRIEDGLDRRVWVSAIGESQFRIPQIKVSLPPFKTSFDLPAVVECGQLVELRLTVTSCIESSGRLRLAVAVGDGYLVAGSSSCVFEVPPLSTHNASLTVIPLLCGPVALPRITLLWERSLGAPATPVGGVTGAVIGAGSSQHIKILDIGGGGNGALQRQQASRGSPRMMYVRPVAATSAVSM